MTSGYMLVTETDTLKLSDEVTRLLRAGWTVHGSPVITVDSWSKQVHYGQAVVFKGL